MSLILLHIHIHTHQISPKLLFIVSLLTNFTGQFARRGTWVTFTKVQIENCPQSPPPPLLMDAQRLHSSSSASKPLQSVLQPLKPTPPLHCVLVKIHCNAHRQLLKRPWPVYRGGVPCINGLWRGHRQTFEEKNFDKKPFLVLLFIFSKQFFSEPFRADFLIYFNFAAKL